MDPMTLLVGQAATSSLLIGQVASMIVIALAVVGTVLLAWTGGFGRLGRRLDRTRLSQVPVVLYCPRTESPANVTLAATLARGGAPGNAPEPALTVVDCEHFSGAGVQCDFACLAVREASMA